VNGLARCRIAGAPANGAEAVPNRELEPVAIVRPSARLNGRDIYLSPELVRDAVEVDRLLGVMSAKNPMVGRI
jgi:hypothetical protein